jgi:hypothetical protein
MEDPCIIEDTIDRDHECENPVVKLDRIPEPFIVMYRYSLKKMQRDYDNLMLIDELKRLTKSTAPKRHYALPYRKGRK